MNQEQKPSRSLQPLGVQQDEAFKPDPRFAQANKEALISLALFALYFAWWYAFAYGLGDGDPENYTYILGFPAWFFYSCIVGFPLLTLVLWITLHLFFKDIPLDSEESEDENSSQNEEQP